MIKMTRTYTELQFIEQNTFINYVHNLTRIESNFCDYCKKRYSQFPYSFGVIKITSNAETIRVIYDEGENQLQLEFTIFKNNRIQYEIETVFRTLDDFVKPHHQTLHSMDKLLNEGNNDYCLK
jgi:hypothetical protein